MTIETHTADYIGKRSEQQDAAGSARLNDRAASHLLVLADGVGGQTGGATASRIAVDTLLNAAASGTFDKGSRQREALGETLEELNDRVRAEITAKPNLDGMATTLVAAIASEDTLQWVSIGDSHLYLFRDGKLRKLNEDHSLATLMVKSGKHAPDDPALDEFRNVIASAVSGEEIKYIDLPEQPVRLQRGDIVLLASDGLDTLPTKKVEALVSELANAPPQKIAAILLSAVETERQPRQDNTTVVVARIEGGAALPAGDAATVAAPPRAHAPGGPRGPLDVDADKLAAESAAPSAKSVVQTTSGSKWVFAALLLVALLAGGAWWYLQVPGAKQAIQTPAVSKPVPEKSVGPKSAEPKPTKPSTPKASKQAPSKPLSDQSGNADEKLGRAKPAPEKDTPGRARQAKPDLKEPETKSPENTVPAPDTLENSAPIGPEPAPGKADAPPASFAPPRQKSKETKRVVPQSLPAFDCQLRAQSQAGPVLSLPDYCRRYFGDRPGIQYF